MMLSRPARRLPRLLEWLFRLQFGYGIFALILLTPATVLVLLVPGEQAAAFISRLTGARLPPWHPVDAASLLLLADILLAAFAVTTGALAGVMRSIADGEPFVAANVTRLRTMAMTMMTLLIVKKAADIYESVVNHDTGGGLESLDLDLALAALIAFVLAEVFREGVRLREENAGTI